MLRPVHYVLIYIKDSYDGRNLADQLRLIALCTNVYILEVTN